MLIAKYDERQTKSLVAVGADRKKLEHGFFRKKMIKNFSQSVECLTFEVSPFRECIFPFYHSLLSPSPAIEQAPTFTFHINLILRQFARMFLIDNLSK